jgi:anti-anti-sigma factor
MSDLHIVTDITELAAAHHRNAGVLTLKGALDYTVRQTVEEFLDQAFTRYGPNLVVDLLEVDFIDSRSTGLLAGCWKRATNEGGWLALIAVERSAARILWITGLASRIPVFTTVEEALAAAPGQ